MLANILGKKKALHSQGSLLFIALDILTQWFLRTHPGARTAEQ